MGSKGLLFYKTIGALCPRRSVGAVVLSVHRLAAPHDDFLKTQYIVGIVRQYPNILGPAFLNYRPMLRQTNMRRGHEEKIRLTVDWGQKNKVWWVCATIGSIAISFSLFYLTFLNLAQSATEGGLTLVRIIRTAPFVNTRTAVKDLEGSAYVSIDDVIWLADDEGHTIYEIDRLSGALLRTIDQAEFVNLTGDASQSMDLEALAYINLVDTLYAFSGAGGTPAAYRLTRHRSGKFQLTDYVSTNVEHGGAVGANGDLWVASGRKVVEYDYRQDTLNEVIYEHTSNILGLGYDGDLWMVTRAGELIRRNLSTGENTIWDLAAYDIRDPRAVEVIDGYAYVTDGYDWRLANRHGIFVFQVN